MEQENQPTPSRWKRTFHSDGGVFLLFFGILLLFGFEEYGYMNYLRHKYESLAPEAFVRLPLNGDTNFLLPWVIGDQDGYAERVHQIRLHGVPCDPAIREYRNLQSWLPDCIPLYLVSLMILPFHSIQIGWIFAEYFSLAIFFLILCFSFRRIFASSVRRPFVYVLAALIPLLTFDAVSELFAEWGRPNIGKWLWLTLDFGFNKRGLFWMLRITSMQITYMLFVIWLFSLAFQLARPPQRHHLADWALGLGCSALVFVHFYEWAVAAGVVGLLLIGALWHAHLKSNRARLLHIAVCGAVFSAVASYLMSYRIDPTVLLRTGIEHGRAWSHWNTASIFPLVIGFWSLRRANASPSWTRATIFQITLASACLAGGALLNLNWVAGVQILPHHFSMLARFCVILLLSTWFIESAADHPPLQRWAPTGVIVLLLITFFNIKSFDEKKFKVAALPRDWQEALTWTQQNIPLDSKMLTISGTIQRLLPIYTKVKLQVADGCPLLSRIPSESNIERFSVLLRTLHVQVPEFLNERWTMPDTFRGIDNLLYMGDSIDPSDYWFNRSWKFILTHYQSDGDPIRVAGYRQQIERLAATASPLHEDYYIWVNTADLRFLTIPVKQQGRNDLIFQNSGVQIYRHRSDI